MEGGREGGREGGKEGGREEWRKEARAHTHEWMGTHEYETLSISVCFLSQHNQ